MSIGILVIVLVIVGTLVAIRSRGRIAKRLTFAYTLGFALSVGGCLGALAWVGAETSGSKNLFHAVNPFVWSGLFVTGVAVLIVNSVRAIRLRSRDERTSE